MANLLEALYVLTTISAVVTLVLLWRERSAKRGGAVRRAAPRWAGLTVGLAVLCVGLYWYLSPR